MATDDERRRAAASLRKIRSGWASGTCYYAIINVLGYPDTSREDGGHALYSLLADLIEPSEPKVKCVAEVKTDGEQLEKLVHEAVVEYAGVDREALLALAEELSGNILVVPAVYGTYQSGYVAACQDIARRIREALGVSDD